jgi:hypothetical protein
LACNAGFGSFGKWCIYSINSDSRNMTNVGYTCFITRIYHVWRCKLSELALNWRTSRNIECFSDLEAAILDRWILHATAMFLQLVCYIPGHLDLPRQKPAIL